MRMKCTPPKNGEREYVNHACSKECPHWKDCLKELSLRRDPRGFKEIPAGFWDLLEENFSLNYKGEPIVWRMGPKKSLILKK